MLSVIHGPTVGGGVFEEVVERAGHRLDRWLVPAAGDAPEPADYDAIMVFGGAMHPDEDARHAWLPGEADFLRRALDRRVPLLGICLGGQLIARAAGAWVGPAPEREIGWLPVDVTPAGRTDPVLEALPDRFEAFQWHSYTFGVPDGATLLATSACCTQAFAIDDQAWALQFHAEVTREMVESWIAEGGGELPMPPGELREATDARMGGWNDVGRRLAAGFLSAAA